MSLASLLISCQESITEGVEPTPEVKRVIEVGGVITDSPHFSVTQTRAAEPNVYRAETIEWMKGALLNGLDVTYSNINDDGTYNTENLTVAILKWSGQQSDANPPRGIYSFYQKGTVGTDGIGDDAIWFDNGFHFFEGQYVPDELREGNGHTMNVANLVTDQSGDSDYSYNSETGAVTGGKIGNYKLLSHYVGMPARWEAAATIDQLLLPFKHRLARVIAYILIDEALLDKTAVIGNTAKLKGYKEAGDPLTVQGKDNPQTTELRFAHVQVLDKVSETAPTGDGAAVLTPLWTEARRVIPHYLTELSQCVKSEDDLQSALPADNDVTPAVSAAEKTEAAGSFIVYTHKHSDKKVYPRDKDWFAAHRDYVSKGNNSLYTQQKYKNVPVYDIIVRPTYETEDDVMYDEAGYYSSGKTVDENRVKALASWKNSIEFEMTLNNDLVYTKEVSFDLNANNQTVIYITIDRAGVDYDDSASEQWVQDNRTDDYYGVNNDLGHNMSMAGSSWQRAISNGTGNYSVTDGNKYDGKDIETEGADSVYVGQYVDDATWIAAFKEAVFGGKYHGDYFVLGKNITLSEGDLPENFVFTGHLDGRGFSITLPSGRNHLFDGMNATYTTVQETASNPNAKDLDGNPLVIWEANVHKEGNYWVPVAGYRAELYNLKVVGGTLFPSSTVYDGTLTNSVVNGYIYNCYDKDHLDTTKPKNPINNYVPIPGY